MLKERLTVLAQPIAGCHLGVPSCGWLPQVPARLMVVTSSAIKLPRILWKEQTYLPIAIVMAAAVPWLYGQQSDDDDDEA